MLPPSGLLKPARRRAGAEAAACGACLREVRTELRLHPIRLRTVLVPHGVDAVHLTRGATQTHKVRPAATDGARGAVQDVKVPDEDVVGEVELHGVRDREGDRLRQFQVAVHDGVAPRLTEAMGVRDQDGPLRILVEGDVRVYPLRCGEDPVPDTRRHVRRHTAHGLHRGVAALTSRKCQRLKSVSVADEERAGCKGNLQRLWGCLRRAVSGGLALLLPLQKSDPANEKVCLRNTSRARIDSACGCHCKRQHEGMSVLYDMYLFISVEWMDTTVGNATVYGILMEVQQ